MDICEIENSLNRVRACVESFELYAEVNSSKEHHVRQDTQIFQFVGLAFQELDSIETAFDQLHKQKETPTIKMLNVLRAENESLMKELAETKKATSGATLVAQ